ncbi:hypothetical protein JCM19992_28060 [Thermostilla marina]
MPYQDLLLILVVIGLWYALNRWILPALGIPTCMSGGCCSTTSCSIEDRGPARSGETEASEAAAPAPADAKSQEVADV